MALPWKIFSLLLVVSYFIDDIIFLAQETTAHPFGQNILKFQAVLAIVSLVPNLKLGLGRSTEVLLRDFWCQSRHNLPPWWTRVCDSTLAIFNGARLVLPKQSAFAGLYVDRIISWLRHTLGLDGQLYFSANYKLASWWAKWRRGMCTHVEKQRS